MTILDQKSDGDTQVAESVSLSRNIKVTAVNDRPSLAVSGSPAAVYTEDEAGVPISGGDPVITIEDLDDTSMSRLEVQIMEGCEIETDELSMPDINGLSFEYVADEDEDFLFDDETDCLLVVTPSSSDQPAPI